MPAAKKKPSEFAKAGKKAVKFLESKQFKEATKKNIDFLSKKKKMNALDAAITSGKTLPSKNKRYPGDTDIKTGPSKGKPIIRPNAKPAPLPKAPKNMAPAKGTKKPGKKK